jgi:signal transduction histidine kinase
MAITWIWWSTVLPLAMAAGSVLLERSSSTLLETRLEELLRQLGEVAVERAGIKVNLIVEGQPALPAKVHLALYRIAQEALSNVVQHAQANRVNIRLCCGCVDPMQGRSLHPQTVLLSISDDGCGFDVDRAPRNRLGLGILRDQAHAIDATLYIDSYPGEGTQITVLWEQTAQSRRLG